MGHECLTCQTCLLVLFGLRESLNSIKSHFNHIDDWSKLIIGKLLVGLFFEICSRIDGFGIFY